MSTSIPLAASVEALHRQVITSINAHWKLFLIQGVLMLFLGMLAVALPNVSTLGIELIVGLLFTAGGVIRLATIARKRHVPGFWSSLLSGLIALGLGGALIVRPLQGVITLTIVMTLFFVIEGIAAIIVALEFRRYLRNWSWTLLGGAINLVLAYLIWKSWPNSTAWVIGLYVGINMIFLGVPLIMTALAARNIGSAAGRPIHRHGLPKVAEHS